MVFCIVFLVVSSISENYWYFPRKLSETTSEDDMNQFGTHIDQFMFKKLPPLQFLEKAIIFPVTRDKFQRQFRNCQVKKNPILMLLGRIIRRNSTWWHWIMHREKIIVYIIYTWNPSLYNMYMKSYNLLLEG